MNDKKQIEELASLIADGKFTEETSPEDIIKIAKYNDEIRKKTAKEILTAQLKECIEAEKRVLKIRKSKDDLYYNGFSLAITNLKMYIKELANVYTSIFLFWASRQSRPRCLTNAVFSKLFQKSVAFA